MTQILDAQHDTARGIGAWVAGHRGTLVVVAATLVVAMGFGGLGLITVFMGPMEAELGWSRSDTSLAYVFSTAGMAIGGLWWGRLSDRMDVRLLLALGAAGMVGSLLAMSALRSLPLFYFAHLVYGGSVFPCCTRLYCRQAGVVSGAPWAGDGHRHRGGAAGQGLLPFFASLAIKAFGWRWAFVEVGCAMLVALALTLPWLRWPQGFRPPAAIAADTPATSRAETNTVAMLAVAAFFCCMCMGVPVVHLAGFVSAVCGSASAGATSMVVAMSQVRSAASFWFDCRPYRPSEGLCRRIVRADCLRGGLSGAPGRMVPDGAFRPFWIGFCRQHDVPVALRARRRPGKPVWRGDRGGHDGRVGGNATGGYAGGVLFDLSLSYTPSFVVASVAGGLNLAVLGALQLLRGSNGRSGEPDGYVAGNGVVR
jgi:MFS family permease